MLYRPSELLQRFFILTQNGSDVSNGTLNHTLLNSALTLLRNFCIVSFFAEPPVASIGHRCDKRLRLQKILCKLVYYFVIVYLNKNHMSETKQNHDGKPSCSYIWKRTHSALHRSSFKSLRNQYHRLILTSKKQYLSNLVSSVSDNPKRLWKTVNTLLHRKSSSPYLYPRLFSR